MVTVVNKSIEPTQQQQQHNTPSRSSIKYCQTRSLLPSNLFYELLHSNENIQ